MKKKVSLGLDKDYVQFLENTKNRLKMAQMRAASAVNRELIQFYWQLGSDLIEKQRAFKWGDRFLEQFSHDIRQSFPGMQGFSVTNLKRMRLFAQEYSDFEISPQLVSELPWGHIAVLIHQVKAIEQREWYAKKILENA